MNNRPTVQSVLTKAIQREIESQELYRDLANVARDDTGREMFNQLAKVEKRHEELLSQYLRGELGEDVLLPEHVVDYKIAEHLDRPRIKTDMKIDQVLLLAAEREKASHDFYVGLAALHHPGKVRDLLEELASQEMEHKHRVEFLYTEVAFPQTGGG